MKGMFFWTGMAGPWQTLTHSRTIDSSYQQESGFWINVPKVDLVDRAPETNSHFAPENRPFDPKRMETSSNSNHISRLKQVFPLAVASFQGNGSCFNNSMAWLSDFNAFERFYHVA